MIKMDYYNQNGEKAGNVELEDKIFKAEVNPAVVHQTVVAYLSNIRRGTASTKTRAEVSGGGKKPWKQKGTGRARHGSNRSPIWKGGGITFGPKPRSYHKDVNKKVKALALQSVLTEKLNKKEIIFVDNIKFDSPSTKQFVSMLKKLNIDSKALVVIQSKDRNVEKSAMNLKNARVITIDGLNTYELINNKYVIMTLESLKNIQKNKEN